jgi:hypothetical protein
VERSTPLAKVGCLFLGHRCSPDSALEYVSQFHDGRREATYLVVGGAGRIGTVGRVRVQSGITFRMHVECNTSRVLIADGLAPGNIVAGQGVQTHVHASTERSFLVGEDLRIAVRCSHR